MYTLGTVEVRWFYPGEIPAQVWIWFCRSGAFAINRTAFTEYYQHGSGNWMEVDRFFQGLKFKSKTLDFGCLQFGERVAGRVEFYQEFISHQDKSHWEYEDLKAYLAFDKQSWLRCYAVIKGQAMELLHPEGDRICTVELARVQVEGGIWWSLGLEARSIEAHAMSQKNMLLATAELVFGQGEPPILVEDASCGYSEWLTRLAGAV